MSVECGVVRMPNRGRFAPVMSLQASNFVIPWAFSSTWRTAPRRRYLKAEAEYPAPVTCRTGGGKILPSYPLLNTP